MNKEIIEQVSVSLVTTCKGRLKYLKKALPSWLKIDYGNFDIIIVDYDDPDGTETYVKRNKEEFLKNSKAKDIKVVKVDNKPLFNLNDARNRGIDASDSELIFMIDSDIIIKNKEILKRIKREYQRGGIFWTNVPISNTNYLEAHDYYKVHFGVNIDKYSILPYSPLLSDLTGTVLFLKKFYIESGKYFIDINKKGYGYDEIEFYLRYLNYVYYNYFYEGNTSNINTSLDNFCETIYLFDLEDFNFIPNTIEEKGKYYNFHIRDTKFSNKLFIKEFFDDFFHRIKFSCKNKENLIVLKTSSFKNIENDCLAKRYKWIKSFFYYISGIKKIEEQKFGEGLLLLKKSVKLNKRKDPFFLRMKIRTLSKIYMAEKRLNAKAGKKYLNIIISKINKLKFKRMEDYTLLLFLYYEKKEYKKYFEIANMILRKKSIDPELKFSLLFKKALIIYDLVGEYSQFYKSLKYLKKLKNDKINIYRKASIFKYIKKYDESLLLFRSLLKEKNTTFFEANIYFHIGEIYYLMNNEEKAKGYFQDALKLNHYHQKAKEYLENMTNNREE